MSMLPAALAGTLFGVLHIALLMRDARRGPAAGRAPLRLLLVGGALFFAIRTGVLRAGFIGWLLGFVAAAVVLYRRLR